MSLYRVACVMAIPRRHEALAARVRESLSPHTRHLLKWAALSRISDRAPAEILLDAFDPRNADGTLDLSRIPADRIITQPEAAA